MRLVVRGLADAAPTRVGPAPDPVAWRQSLTSRGLFALDAIAYMW